MKKLVLSFFVLALTLSIGFSTKADAAAKKTNPSKSAIQSAVVKYRSGNYVGSMQDLEDILEKNPNNYYAKYYLALCHTQLGHRDKARPLYEELVEAKNISDAVVYYSQKAIDCLDNPDSEMCKPAGSSTTTDDMTKFIESGKKIHPAAMDRINNNKMQRELEYGEYVKKNNLKSDAADAAPTNQEIAEALDILTKAGINPYTNNSYANNQINSYMGLMAIGGKQNGFNPYMLNAIMQNNPQAANMLLYNQMLNSGNLF